MLNILLGDRWKTFKPLQLHGTAKRQAFSDAMLATLGSGNVKQAVQTVPPGEDLEEWIAVNGQ